MLKILLFLLMLQFVSNAGQTPYECGLHGRFEYCIDGIPGCIVGCHCHPGYYFDTDTKICESSAKMFQERRFYSPPLSFGAQVPQQQAGQQQQAVPPQQVDSPQRSPQQFLPQFLPKTPPASELLSEIKEYVGADQERNNEDNLEEWLYKQFSKTIESQVLNKNAHKATRRSGGQTGLTISQQQRRKASKAQSKKGPTKTKKTKPRALDENDSVFDDPSSEETYDGESGGAGAAGGGDGSGERDKGECKNEGKKMIIIKKAPKIPLPPFIFMPQMDGSYYPANGLAAPPPMTLFPIVPVPPMMPIMPMMQMTHKPADCNTPTASTATIATTASTSSSPDVITTSKPDNTTKNSTKLRRRKPNPFLVSPYSRSNKNMNRLASAIGNLAHGDGGGDQLLPDIQSPFDPNPNQRRRYRIKENPSGSDGSAPSPLMNHLSGRKTASRDLNSDGEPDEPAPRFQYLTDLIHTFDTQTKTVPPMNYNSFGLVPKKKTQVSVDDKYFTNLGKEIVSLMNKMDNSESDSDGTKSLINSKGAWDRQVRSPPPKNVRVKSNEDLLHLEKEVYSAATSAPALSLAELEEKIRKVDEEFINIESEAINEEDAIILKQPATHLNVNLLESANIQPISLKTKEDPGFLRPDLDGKPEGTLGRGSFKTKQSFVSGPIQSVLIHSKLKHAEPETSALIHFEVRGSDPKPPLISPIRPPYIHLPPVGPPRIPVRSMDQLLKKTTRFPTFESASITPSSFNIYPQNHHAHIFKSQKALYKKPKKRRHPKPKTTTPLPTTTTSQPKSTHPTNKEVKNSHHYPSQVISSAVIHKEPRHSQASNSPPKIRLERKPHSLLKNHHLANNNIQTLNTTKTSVFGAAANNFGYNLFQPTDFDNANPVHPSSPQPSKAPSHHGELSSYEKWEFDKQLFYYPKLTADLHAFNKFKYVNKPKILIIATTESTTIQPVTLPVMSPENSPLNLPENSPVNLPENSPMNLPENSPVPQPIVGNVDAYPYHHKLHRQYFFPGGRRQRHHQEPSWYFDTS